MTNGNGGPELIEEVLRALAAEYGWPDYGAEQLPAVALEPTAVAGLSASTCCGWSRRRAECGGWRPAHADDASSFPRRSCCRNRTRASSCPVRLAGDVHARRVREGDGTSPYSSTAGRNCRAPRVP